MDFFEQLFLLIDFLVHFLPLLFIFVIFIVSWIVYICIKKPFYKSIYGKVVSLLFLGTLIWNLIYFGGEDRVRPGGDGLALHQHHRGRAVSADLLSVCNLDPRRINHLKRLRLLCKKRGAYSSSFSFITQFSAAYSKNIPINAFLV